MTPRERYITTLLFSGPDRIPFCPGEPREATLAAWHEQGLPAGSDWRSHLFRVLDVDPQAMPVLAELGVDFRLIPQFEEAILERRADHLVVQDWKGNVCEISGRYDPSYLRAPKDFVTRRWLRCPVSSQAEWEQIKRRYDPATPSRLPPGMVERAARRREQGHVLVVALPGPFWQMREWCGLEPLCTFLVRQPNLVADMASFWSEFVATLLDRILRSVVPDVLLISEDMAYKGRAMISPTMTRRFCLPSWRRWTGQVRAAGCPLVDLDSDGCVGELIPLWLEAGINVCNPVEVAAHNNIVALRAQFGRRMAYRGGVDKRAMAQGGPALHAELARLEPVVRDGGFIPGCDHAVPPDVSWPAFVDYGRRLARLTGW